VKLDFDRLSKLEVVLLPCPFEDDSYTVVDSKGVRRGRVTPRGGKWVAINREGEKGICIKIEDAVKLLL